MREKRAVMAVDHPDRTLAERERARPVTDA